MINQMQNIINRKVIIKRKGYSGNRLAEELEVTSSAISNTIRGISMSFNLQKKICDILGVSLVDFWPELYGAITKNITSEINNDNPNIIRRKVVMLQKGYNLPKLAKVVGHTKQAVSLSILGLSTSLRIHRKICAVLGVSLVEFWPDLYGEETSGSTQIIQQENNQSV